MAKQRYIYDSFWTDSYIETLNVEERLLFIYLLTNPLCNIAGMYEITNKRIEYETGLKNINKLKEKFIKDNKIIIFNDWIIITNFIKNQSLNENVKEGIRRIINSLPDDIKALEGFQSLIKSRRYLTLLNLTLLNLTLPNGESAKNELLTNLERIMYNYCDIDEDGNPILKKNSLKRITKAENTELIKIGLLWRKMCSDYLKINENEVVMKNIYYPIRSVYDREKFKKEDYEKLFKYFLNDKNIKQEDKMGFDLCMSEKYVAKYKIAKRSQDKPISNYQIADNLKL